MKTNAPTMTMEGGSDLRPEAAASSTQKNTQNTVKTRIAVPNVSRPLVNWFTWYARRYIRRHFHSLRVCRAGLPPESNLPIVLYSNHASWWDPLVGLVVKAELFQERTLFAPMEAAMLQRYKMFARLGFFAVEPRSRRGAVQFLRTAEAVLQSPRPLLAVTPQSRFADVRERPLQFEAGLGHLAGRVERALFLPVAAEYVFWEERLPEILVRFGEGVEVPRDEESISKAGDWTRLFEQKLAAAQEALAVEAQRRDPGHFQILLRGGAGQGGVYDWWRGVRAALRGEKFRREHGHK